MQISVDDGATWWYLPYDSHTHHTLSRMNPYSPFYDEGIFDGSIHSGGCPTRSQTFDAETIDVSNLRPRGPFQVRLFSDTWVEKTATSMTQVSKSTCFWMKARGRHRPSALQPGRCGGCLTVTHVCLLAPTSRWTSSI